jgi:hypothetical protein
MIPDRDSELDSIEIEPFKKAIQEYIDSDFNPYISEIGTLKYEAAAKGSLEPIADFACAECGKKCVSILSSFYPFGHCCFCGTDNEVSSCERCGAVFNSDGGRSGFCNGCLPDEEG